MRIKSIPDSSVPEAYRREFEISDGFGGDALRQAIYEKVGLDWRFLDLRGAPLSGANLASLNLQGVDARRASLQGANLQDAELSTPDYTEFVLPMTDLEGADLSEADLRGAKVQCVHLREVNFQNAKLQGADFTESNFADTCLVNAQMQDADLTSVYLENTNFAGADLTGVTFTDAEGLERAKHERIISVSLPKNDFTLPAYRPCTVFVSYCGAKDVVSFGRRCLPITEWETKTDRDMASEWLPHSYINGDYSKFFSFWRQSKGDIFAQVRKAVTDFRAREA